jgi:hypothetical protein
MNIETLYRYVMGSAILFLSGWLALLAGAFTYAFRKSAD